MGTGSLGHWAAAATLQPASAVSSLNSNSQAKQSPGRLLTFAANFNRTGIKQLPAPAGALGGRFQLGMNCKLCKNVTTPCRIT